YLKRVRHESVPTARAAVAGASFGGAAGFVATLITLAIPGVGVAVAGGALATVLGGLAVGATAGGLIGALADMGISREEAPLYEEAVRRGILFWSRNWTIRWSQRPSGSCGRTGPAT
ncbi:MAG: hypothetical protein ABUS51_09945, partial [Acidobacteriota bacterium]